MTAYLQARNICNKKTSYILSFLIWVAKHKNVPSRKIGKWGILLWTTKMKNWRWLLLLIKLNTKLIISAPPSKYLDKEMLHLNENFHPSPTVMIHEGEKNPSSLTITHLFED